MFCRGGWQAFTDVSKDGSIFKHSVNIRFVDRASRYNLVKNNQLDAQTYF